MKRWIPLALLLAACSQDGPSATATSAPAPAPRKEKADTGMPAPASPQKAPARMKQGARGPSDPVSEPAPAPTTTTGGYMGVDDFTQEQSLEDRQGRMKTRREDGDKSETKRPEAPRATTEFGGKVYLSNDDTMSLASAQRVLWSVSEGRAVASSELRPHELLNYFTFEAPTITKAATFGVGASAVRTADGVALALTVTGASPQRRPLDLTVLLDRSGSMEGERMTLVKRGLTRMVDRLHVGDRVNVVLFDDKVDVVRKGFQVGTDDLDDLRLLFEDVTPRGSTNLDAGLEAAYALVRSRDLKGRDARVLVVTDARITAGDLDAARVSEIARAFDESRVRLAAIGVGDDVDDRVLQQLTEKGRGAYVFLGSEKVVDRVFGSGFDALVNVVADDVRFALDLPDSLGMSRFYGEEMSTTKADVQPVSFFAGSTQVFLQDLKVAEGGYGKSDPLVLDLAWRDPLTGKDRTQRWTSTLGAALGGDLSNVTKARALMAWTDLVRVGSNDCTREKKEWQGRAKTFGGDTETRYLDGLVASWCPVSRGGAIAEAE
ncbi:MAG: VWA domain-containing protein [Myxococcota bacterium]